jgi:hypothetical protein
VKGLDACAKPTIEERDKIAPSRFLSLPPSSVSAAHRFGSDWSRADMAGPAAGSAQSRMTPQQTPLPQLANTSAHIRDERKASSPQWRLRLYGSGHAGLPLATVSGAMVTSLPPRF